MGVLLRNAEILAIGACQRAGHPQPEGDHGRSVLMLPGVAASDDADRECRRAIEVFGLPDLRAESVGGRGRRRSDPMAEPDKGRGQRRR